MTKDVGIVLLGEDGGEQLLCRLRDWLKLSQRIVYADPALSDELASFLNGVGIQCVPSIRLRNRTRAAWRNEAIATLVHSEPKPQFVQWLRTDSELSPQWIGEATEYLCRNARVAVACGRVEFVGRPTARGRLHDAQCNAHVGHCTGFSDEALMRLQAFEIVAGFDECLGAMEETDFVCRLGWHGWDAQMLNASMTRRGWEPSGWYEWLCEQISQGQRESNLLAHSLAPAVRFGRRQRWQCVLNCLLGGAAVVGVYASGKLLFAGCVFVMLAIVGMIKVVLRSPAPPTSPLMRRDRTGTDRTVTAISTALKICGDLKYCVSHFRQPIRHARLFGGYLPPAAVERTKSTSER